MNMKRIGHQTRNASRSIECDTKAWSLGSEMYVAPRTQIFNPGAK